MYAYYLNSNCRYIILYLYYINIKKISYCSKVNVGISFMNKMFSSYHNEVRLRKEVRLYCSGGNFADIDKT